jgi:hypothetical protein
MNLLDKNRVCRYNSMTLQWLRSTTIDAPPPPLLVAAFVAVGQAREQERTLVHPRLPCVAYLEEWHEEEEGGGGRGIVASMLSMLSSRRGGRGGGGTAAARRHTSESPSTLTTMTTTVTARSKKRDQLVVQEYIRDCPRGGADNDIAAINHDGVGEPPIASLLMKEVSSIVNGYRRGSGATSRPGRRNGGRTTGRGGAAEMLPSLLGKLVSIVFLDEDALSWTTRQRRGALSNSDAATTIRGAMMTDGNDDCHNSDKVFRGMGRTTASTTSMGGRGLCLGLQFAHALVLLRLNDEDGRAAGGRMMGTETCTQQSTYCQ